MTKGEAPTTAEQGQAPADAAVTENTAAAETAAPEQAASAPQYADRMNAAEQAAVAAAAAELEAPVEAEVEAEVAAQLASAAEAQAKAKADFDEKKDKEDEDAEDAPVDLAMAPADIADVIASADGARAVSGAEGEGEASALAGGDGEGIPVIGLVAAGAVAIAAGILIASDDEDEAPQPGPGPDPEPEPEPEPEPGAPEFTSGGTAEVDENVSTDTVVYDADATDAEGDEITYSIVQEGDDAAAFEIDPETGEITFVTSPDFETQESYTITVVATDSEGNAAQQEVVITINDIDEEVVNLDDLGGDVNLGVPAEFDAGDGDYIFTDTAEEDSYTVIENFAAGDVLQISEGAEVSYGTTEDINDLLITIEDAATGTFSQIVLDEVLADDAPVLLNETAVEAYLEFGDFIQTIEVEAQAVA